jgi:hypothetical protein
MEMEVSNDHSRIRNYFPNQSSRENCSLKQWVLGMVRQWQQLFFDKRYASTEMINLIL